MASRSSRPSSPRARSCPSPPRPARGAVERARRGAAVPRPLRRFAVGARGWRSGDSIAQRIARSLPEVLICYDDKLALAVMDGLRAQGVDVPGDVAIIGFDGIPFAALSNPRLRTIGSPSPGV